jgi:hypothetical protein
MGALSTLAAHEAVIRDGLQTFVAVGNALAAIRDGKLYRESHGTFEAYCSDKWKISRRSAYDLIATSEAAENVQEVAQITREQARPLATLPTPELQREALAAAVEASDGKPTAKHVEQAVSRIRPLPKHEPDAEEQKAIEQSEKDSGNLFSLKRYWRQAGKRDRAAFIAWTKNN